MPNHHGDADGPVVGVSTFMIVIIPLPASVDLLSGRRRLLVGRRTSYGVLMPALRTHRRPVLLELDLTQMPVEQEPDDPISRLRSRGRHRLRPTLHALHEAANDPRVVGLIAKVGARKASTSPGQ